MVGPRGACGSKFWQVREGLDWDHIDRDDPTMGMPEVEWHCQGIVLCPQICQSHLRSRQAVDRRSRKDCACSSASIGSTERAQYPLTKEYVLKQNIKGPCNFRYLPLFKGVLGLSWRDFRQSTIRRQHQTPREGISRGSRSPRPGLCCDAAGGAGFLTLNLKP